MRVEDAVRRPGVSAEDLLAVVRVHADRVHDAVRRLGVDPEIAVEVVESSAEALVDAVAQRPERVSDAAGWWFARAWALSRSSTAEAPDLPLGGGLLSADEDQIVLAEAIAELPEPERLALLLRDAYRLPWPTVAAALGVNTERAVDVVARARLRAVPLLDDEPAPPVPAHAGALAALAQLGEGGPVTPQDATVDRHVKGCPSCAAVTAAQSRVHLLLSGLAVVALAPDVRPVLLSQVEQHALASLPPAASLVLTDDEWEEWDDEQDVRVLPPLLAALGVMVAVVLGVGLGVLLSRGAGAVLPASGGVLPAVTLPPVEQPPPITLPTDLPPPPPIPTPRTTVFFLPPRTTAPATATPTLTASPTERASAATLQVEPRSGPNGATLRVTGTGWPPRARVVVEYLDTTGRPTGSRTAAVVGDDGTFITTLVARDPSDVPGQHEVRASDGTTTRSAAYEATS